MANPLYDALFAPLAGRGDGVLLLPGGGTITGAEIAAQTARIAGALGAAGVTAGERVVVQVAKSPAFLALYGATLATGAVLLPLNTAYTAAETGYFIADAAPRVVIVDPARAEAIAPPAAAAGAQVLTLDAAGGGSLAEAAAAMPATFAPVARDADDLAALLYTSGTTGRSKGAMLTQRNLLSNAEVLADLWGFGAEDVLLHALPVFHTHGLFVATNIALLSRARMIWLPGFDLEALIAEMPRASVLMGVPTFYTRLLDDPRLDRALTAGMRLFVSGSARLLAETHRAFAERTGQAILERYGMTETNMITSNPLRGERRAGTVGQPLPGVELRITDPETGRTLAPGETGMIEVRGPNVFRGYWRMPEKTAAEMRADGFFVTGDLGVQGADGYVAIVGRARDLIISGGFNIYPKEVELILDDQPGVVESAVVGVPHPDFGEAVLAILVPEAGRAPDLGAIRAALAENLARFKQPKDILIAEALPRNAMGKVQKAELRARHAGHFTKGT
ncbi:MAG: malonate--CoA ligase [Gemmobacter sp.]